MSFLIELATHINGSPRRTELQADTTDARTKQLESEIWKTLMRLRSHLSRVVGVDVMSTTFTNPRMILEQVHYRGSIESRVPNIGTAEFQSFVVNYCVGERSR